MYPIESFILKASSQTTGTLILLKRPKNYLDQLTIFVARLFKKL